MDHQRELLFQRIGRFDHLDQEGWEGRETAGTDGAIRSRKIAQLRDVLREEGKPGGRQTIPENRDVFSRAIPESSLRVQRRGAVLFDRRRQRENTRVAGESAPDRSE